MIMEIILLIMENHGKIMEFCFWISVGTLVEVKESIKNRLALIEVKESIKNRLALVEVKGSIKKGMAHGHLIIRVYLMEFWLSPEVLNWDPIISPRAVARDLIMVERLSVYIGDWWNVLVMSPRTLDC